MVTHIFGGCKREGDLWGKWSVSCQFAGQCGCRRNGFRPQSWQHRPRPAALRRASVLSEPPRDGAHLLTVWTLRGSHSAASLCTESLHKPRCRRARDGGRLEWSHSPDVTQVWKVQTQEREKLDGDQERPRSAPLPSLPAGPLLQSWPSSHVLHVQLERNSDCWVCSSKGASPFKGQASSSARPLA